MCASLMRMKVVTTARLDQKLPLVAISGRFGRSLFANSLTCFFIGFSVFCASGLTAKIIDA